MKAGIEYRHAAGGVQQELTEEFDFLTQTSCFLSIPIRLTCRDGGARL